MKKNDRKTSNRSGLALVLVLLTAACSALPAAPVSSTPPPQAAPLIGAGGIAPCGVDADDQTAAQIRAFLDALPEGAEAAVFAAGDTAYETGTDAEFQQCYHPSWGQFLPITRPAIGNHEYKSGGAGYFNYFGPAAGEAGKGYYSYDLGAWHIAVLNTNCAWVACGPTSEQVLWLQEDLALAAQLSRANGETRCQAAYMHHPRWSSGLAGSTYWIDAIWQSLSAAGVEVVLAGHDHDYERFTPLDAAGQPVEAGLRQFVVGTGGGYLRPFGSAQPNSEFRLDNVHGVLALALHPDHYEWQFISASGEVLDSGSAPCQ